MSAGNETPFRLNKIFLETFSLSLTISRSSISHTTARTDKAKWDARMKNLSHPIHIHPTFSPVRVTREQAECQDEFFTVTGLRLIYDRFEARDQRAEKKKQTRIFRRVGDKFLCLTSLPLSQHISNNDARGGGESTQCNWKVSTESGNWEGKLIERRIGFASLHFTCSLTRQRGERARKMGWVASCQAIPNRKQLARFLRPMRQCAITGDWESEDGGTRP